MFYTNLYSHFPADYSEDVDEVEMKGIVQRSQLKNGSKTLSNNSLMLKEKYAAKSNDAESLSLLESESEIKTDDDEAESLSSIDSDSESESDSDDDGSSMDEEELERRKKVPHWSGKVNIVLFSLFLLFQNSNYHFQLPSFVELHY